MQYVLAKKIEELEDGLILDAIEWYPSSNPKVISEYLTCIIPRLCSVIDKEVIQLVIPNYGLGSGNKGIPTCTSYLRLKPKNL